MRRVAAVFPLVPLLIVALALGACGGTKPSRTERASSATQSAAAAAAEGAASHSSEGGGEVDGTVRAEVAASGQTDGETVAATGGSPTNESPPPTIDTKRFEGDFVFGSPVGRSQDDPRPRSCTFATGELCRMRVEGTYKLVSEQVASIQVGAYEDGAERPAFSTTLPNARKGSSHWFVDQFTYQVRPGVKSVAIIATLLDANGRELARAQPTTFPVGG